MNKIFDIKIEQSDDIELKGTSEGDLLVSVNSGGQFAGERLSGRVMPVGCSTSYSPESGLNRIYESVLLETDDGAHIFMKIDAYLQLPQELEDRFLAGEAVSAEEYYYKGSVCFNAGDSRGGAVRGEYRRVRFRWKADGGCAGFYADGPVWQYPHPFRI